MRVLPLFLWVLVPLGVWLAYTTFGTPHIAATYRFLDNGDRYNPRAARYYIDCTYYGWAGVFTVPAKHGDCPWVKFFKSGATNAPG